MWVTNSVFNGNRVRKFTRVGFRPCSFNSAQTFSPMVSISPAQKMQTSFPWRTVWGIPKTKGETSVFVSGWRYPLG